MIHFADGSEYELEHFTINERMGVAFVSVKGLSMAETAAIFDDRNKMREIQIGNFTLKNYVLDTLSKEAYGTKAQISRHYWED